MSGKKNVLLVGVTGSGKSSLGNLLLGFEAFKVGDSACGETVEGSVATSASGEFCVGDTQGLNDPNDSQVLVRNRITNVISKYSEGIDVFLVVVRMERFVASTSDALRYLFEGVLGTSAYANCIIVFTQSEAKYVQLSTKTQAQIDWLKPEKQVDTLQALIKQVSGRVVFVANPPIHPDDDEKQTARNQDLRSLSYLELAQTIRQFRPVRPYLSAEVVRAQEEHKRQLQLKETQERQAREAREAKERAMLEQARQQAYEEHLRQLRLQEEHRHQLRLQEERLHQQRLQEERQRELRLQKEQANKYRMGCGRCFPTLGLPAERKLVIYGRVIIVADRYCPNCNFR